MKISAFDVRVGNLLEYEKGLWRVSKTEHVKPGKGGAFMQMEMKNIETGTKTNTRFRSEDKVEKAVVEPRSMQFLYSDDSGYVFMDNDNYEQMTLSADALEGQSEFLLPNTDVQINFHNDRAIGVELPSVVILTVVEADPVVRGQTAASSYKPARVETGLAVLVPPFIETGTRIRVNTTDGSYLDRA